MKTTRILSLLLALIMVLGMLPVSAFATDSTGATESTTETTATNTSGTWTYTRGAGTATNENGVLSITPSNYQTLYMYKNATWNNFVLETEYSYTGNYVGVVFRSNGVYNGMYFMNKTGNANRNIMWFNQATAAEQAVLKPTQASSYSFGDRIKVRVTVRDNILKVQEMIVGKDADWITVAENFSLGELNSDLLTAGEVGFYSRAGSGLKVYQFDVTDTDTGYKYRMFEPEYTESDGTIAGWQPFFGNISVNYVNETMKINSNTTPGTVIFADRKFENYEMEVEMQLNSGTWFGVMYRTDGNIKGLYQINHGSGGHGMGTHATNWITDEANQSATGAYTPYTRGTVLKLKVVMQDNKLSAYSKTTGDSDYIAELENAEIPDSLKAPSYVGISMQYSETVVYSVSIKDLDSDYVYTSDFSEYSDPEGTWQWTNKNGTVTTENGVMSINANAAPAAYSYVGVNWTNYELEAEYSLTGQYAGIIFRENGGTRGTFRLNQANGARDINLISTNTWNHNVVTASGYNAYTAGKRIKVKMTMQNNLLTIKTMIVGVDTDWFTDVENFDVKTLYNGALADSGQIGFFTRNGSGMQVYAFRIKDTDTGYVYDMLPQTGTWQWTNKTGTVTTENNVMSITANAAPAAYSYVGANWTNYKMEAEYSLTGQYAGIIFRENGGTRGTFRLIQSNGVRDINLITTNTWNHNVATASGHNAYPAGQRIKLQVTMQNNLLTIKTMIVGVDTDWFTDIENFDIKTLHGGALADSGQIGFFTRHGSGMKVYSLVVTDTDTGHTYRMFAPEEQPITESVVFDGNHVIDTSAVLPQTPDTVELWFKTENTAAQTLIHNEAGNYGFYIQMNAEGKLVYHEANDGADITLTSANSYRNGQWHKVVVRRYYDQGSGLLKADMTVFTDDRLVDKASMTKVIGSAKKEAYDSNSGKLPTGYVTKIGYQHNNLYYFTGEIAEIRMWDYAKTDDEIAKPRTRLNGNEDGLLHDFAPENGTNFVDLVTSKTDNEITADMIELWMENYVIGDADYRIAVMGDLQQLTEQFEVNVRNYFQWVRDHAEELNIKLVISMGDMVNTCTPEQMHIVSEAASVLDGVVPFIPLTGNHDYPNTKRSSELWNEYFPYEKFSQYDYFGGAYEEGKMENVYYLMNINGVDYMFMALEYKVREEMVEWANEVIAAHPNHQVVLIEHNYLNHNNEIVPENETLQNTGITAVDLYEKLISKHDNIVMALCGHYDYTGVARRTDITASGHLVHSLGFDRSRVERYQGTVNLLGLLGFTNGSNTVQVNSYSPIRDQYFRSSDQFEIELDWDKEYVPAPEIQVIVDEAMAQKVASAKAALFGGNANAYVQIANAGSVTSVVTDKTYAADAKLNVFGESVSAWYAEGGNVYVHILALGAADTVTLKGETEVIVQTKAFNAGKLEITTPADLDRSYYDYLLSRWNATIYGAEQIALTSAKSVGETVIVYFNGAYQMMTVTEALKRNVAVIDVAAQDYSGEIALIENDVYSSGKLIIAYQGALTVDGDLADWNENILATGRVMNGLYGTENKNVTYYAYLADEGLYVAALANHELYVNNAPNWSGNTNLEFYLNGDTVRLWITANPDCVHGSVQGTIKTVQTETGYRSIAEGFVPMDKLPLEALSGELKIGFAWKTPGDNIKHHNMTDGYDWWYLSRRHPSKIVEQYFVNASGIGLYSSMRLENNIQLDGDFSDFGATALENKLSVYSQDGVVGFDLYAQYIAGNGVYVGVEAQSKTNPRPFDTDAWYSSTNLEFYIGENQYYINSRGAAVGNGLFAKNVYLDQYYNETDKLYHTTMEFFIPESSMCTATYNTKDYLRMGFAFKPTGESVLLNGHTEATDFWHMYGHGPSDTANQFYVYKNGIHLAEQPDYMPYAAVVNGIGYDTVQEAVNNANGGIVKLYANSDETVIAVGDLYLDLNGYSLKKVTVSGTLYGMDSATNEYTASGAKIETVVGTYATHYRNSDAKRYLAIAEEQGVSFHRFYMGITKVSLAPAVTGFGYKAEFYGDDAVQTQIASIGYNLWLTEDRVITRTADFKNLLTLRLKNFDVENYGEASVNASVMITLIDGTVIESLATSYSMRQMLEQIAENFYSYKPAQRKAVQALCLSNATMQTWNIAPILNWTASDVVLSNNYFTETEGGVYTLTTDSDALHLVDDVLIDGAAAKNAYYSVKGNLTLTNAADWGQARILISADPENEYFIALERLPSGKYQIFTMSKENQEAWDKWELIMHEDTNGTRNSIQFEVIVIGDTLSFLVDDVVVYTNNVVAMSESTVKFTGYNVATTTVEALSAQVFESQEAAESYLAEKTADMTAAY